MTYRELLDLYKEGKLAEAQAEKVKKDIERQEAISDYLLDEDELGAGSFDDELGELGELAADDTSLEFAKMVNGSIRRAFRKLGVTVFVVTLVAVLFIQFALPNIVDLFYYDPGKLIGEDKKDENYTQMGLDMGVYSELVYPLDYRRYVSVDDRGYGNYDIVIRKGYGLAGQEIRDLAGRIEKGKLTLYYQDFMRPYGNSFKWDEYTYRKDDEPVGADTKTPIEELFGKTNFAEMKRVNREAVESLSDNDYYICYVTTEHQMKYEDFMRFVEKNPWTAQGWCAVRVMDGQHNPPVGFQYDPFISSSLNWDKEKYPNLVLWQESMEKGSFEKEEKLLKTEKYAKTHFLSMLKYLGDQKQFMTMMDEGTFDADSAIEYVKQNGLVVYGFAVTADKKTIRKMLDTEGVFYVSTKELK